MNDTLSLKEFIEQTLVEVCEAVESARNKFDYIAPKIDSDYAEGKSTLISFDIAVTVSESQTNAVGKGSKAGGVFGISVLKADVGMQNQQQETANQNLSKVSRIQLNVPVYFRHDEGKRKERENKFNKPMQAKVNVNP